MRVTPIYSRLLGLVKKSKLTAEFLKRKVAEYEALQPDIKALRTEMNLVKGGSQ